MKQLLNSAVLEMQLLVVFFFCKMLETADWDTYILFSPFFPFLFNSVIIYLASAPIPSERFLLKCQVTHQGVLLVFISLRIGVGLLCVCFFTWERGWVAMCIFFDWGKGLGCYVHVCVFSLGKGVGLLYV